MITLVTNRSVLPDRHLLALARKARPRRLQEEEVRLEVVRARRDHAPVGGRMYANADPHLVRIWLGPAKAFPYRDRPSRRTNKPWGRLATIEEAALAVLAHEFWHVYQVLRDEPLDEAAADDHALRTLARFRGRK